jgi:hypothetical protein
VPNARIAEAGSPELGDDTEDPDRRAAFGSMKGEIWMADDFNAPLPDDVLADWGIIDP